MDRSRNYSAKFMVVWFCVWSLLVGALIANGIQLYGGIILSVAFVIVAHFVTLMLNYFLKFDV